MTKGHDLIWQQVSAAAANGAWDDTTFILTYDDWGGYADHVVTPDIETLPDALHPNGFQAIAGSRVPLVMFGGRVRQEIEHSWHTHASIARTAIDLLGLAALGVPRVDTAPSLAARLLAKPSRPAPPAFGSQIVQPAPPVPTPKPTHPKAWPAPLAQPMPPLVVNAGPALAAPLDGVVKPKPPKVPTG